MCVDDDDDDEGGGGGEREKSVRFDDEGVGVDDDDDDDDDDNDDLSSFFFSLSFTALTSCFVFTLSSLFTAFFTVAASSLCIRVRVCDCIFTLL